MTIGYPDYQRVTHRSGGQLLAQTNLNIPGNVIPGFSSGFLTVDQFDQISIYADTSTVTKFYLVQIYWYPLLNSNASFRVDSYVLGPGTPHSFDVPVESPRCVIAVSLQNQTAETGINIFAYGKSNNVHSIPFLLNGTPAIAQSIAIAASGSDTETVNTVGNYRATIHVGTHNTKLWNLFLQYYDIGIPGFARYMSFNFDERVSDITQEIVMPRTPVRMTLTNLDTVSRNFDISLVLGRT